MKHDSLYIIMPAYNEEKNIGTVIEQWYPVVERIGGDSRLVILNDGSKDATYKKIQNYQKNYDRLIGIDKPNEGHGGTILRGYRYAVEKGADYIFQTDSDGQEYHRMSNSSEADERTLREIYFPAFETAVKKAQPYTFMCSYNQINGTFASENKWLLTDVLRGDWGFKGYVMSDWGAVNDRVKGLEAGLELEMPSSNGVNDALIVQAVKDGSLKEDILDQAVERILRIIFEYADNRAPQEFTMEKDHEEARHIAEESMVLLKNDEQILPLKASEKIAFIGGFAKKPRFQGGGSSHINCFKITNALDSVPSDAQVTYAEGYPADKDLYDDALAAEAIKTAAAADKKKSIWD